MKVIQAPSLERAALLIRFQRAMSARPRIFLPRGSVLAALLAAAGDPARVGWAWARAPKATARTTGAIKRARVSNFIGSPAGTSRQWDAEYTRRTGARWAARGAAASPSPLPRLTPTLDS